MIIWLNTDVIRIPDHTYTMNNPNIMWKLIAGEYVEKLPETGVLCKDTYDRLRDMLKRILQDLKKLGYTLGFNPLLKQNADKMISFITQIQDDFDISERNMNCQI